MMEKTEFREALATLGLSQGAAADFLGCSIRAINGYANGDAIPKAVAIALWCMTTMHLTIDDVPK